ncbi:ATP synthase subunit I [Anaerobacillus alkaliphilus]|uniref:ATP synthase subunit I n=1 Tax=Anaerobacillus alkaliphilus TaxID=1548597 RepID=A0A4Q0VWP4_9BACI|nr:ATP synthase subunit I [Anaerobacillus alkaliphilus]RXJ02701.1 ATP synthase subunit I [Anaerobacillus alkaliphilus]
MGDYIALTKRYTLYTVIIMSLFLVLALVTPYQPIFLGLLLGSIISLSNLWSTYFQVKRLGESVEAGRAKFSLGTLFRIALVLGAVYIAYQYPDNFHFISVVIGLMLTYIIIFINSIFQLKRL